MVPDRDGVARVVEWRRWMQAGAVARPALGKVVTAGFTAGVCIALWAPALPPGWLRWGLLALGLCAWLRMHRWRWSGALLAGAGWAALQAGWVLDAQLPHRLEGSEITVAGTVVSLPEVEPRRTRFRFHVDDVADQHPALRGRQLQLAWYDDFSATQAGPRMQLGAGARWRFTLRLRAPRGLANPGGFDAERHALAQRITASGLVRAETARRLAASSGLQAWRERGASAGSTAPRPACRRGASGWQRGSGRGLADARRAMCRPWRWAIPAGWTMPIGRCCGLPV
ncbi:DNA internalization-related competence protein ComEC/Rec2 (fragment) [uncultured Stenotrophomonas sp.]|uniref:DNA internalization-related competence protein ComEC/Rec2 n=1 Tax=uncultured Stenotrophomonas sp. TaxID=165438 RepID=A0A1Y5Q2N5_9GAMM